MRRLRKGLAGDAVVARVPDCRGGSPGHRLLSRLRRARLGLAGSAGADGPSASSASRPTTPPPLERIGEAQRTRLEPGENRVPVAVEAANVYWACRQIRSRSNAAQYPSSKALVSSSGGSSFFRFMRSP